MCKLGIYGSLNAFLAFFYFSGAYCSWANLRGGWNHQSVAKSRTDDQWKSIAVGVNCVGFKGIHLAKLVELETFHVNGRTKTAVRDRRMKEFEVSDRALVTNARCLSEGVDVPDIDCVLFADPKRSVVDIVQASGRALRPTEAGSISY